MIPQVCINNPKVPKCALEEKPAAIRKPNPSPPYAVS